jgi:hypothetical protein
MLASSFCFWALATEINGGVCLLSSGVFNFVAIIMPPVKCDEILGCEMVAPYARFDFGRFSCSLLFRQKEVSRR